jgi:mono/diheme cytochrome c family protein
MTVMHLMRSRSVHMRHAALASIVLAMQISLAGCGSKSDSSGSANSGNPGAGGGANSAPGTTTPAAGAPASSAADTSAAPHVTSGTASVEIGEKVFKLRCTPCHGPDGHGTGPLAATLNPKPRNFHDATYMHAHDDAELLGIIHNGKGGMPPWKAILSEVEMQSALMYVRTFAGKP